MQIYDLYADYRPELRFMDHATLGQAELMTLIQDSKRGVEWEEKVEGGYRTADGKFIPTPTVTVYMDIALREAKEQLDEHDWAVMPDEEQISVRFPGIDPVGKYSVIDMKMAERMAAVKATLESRSPAVRERAQAMIDALDKDEEIRKLRREMERTAEQQRLLTRASKLCHDATGRRLLHEKGCALMTDLAVEEYDKYLQGLEYVAGVKTDPVPREVLDFFQNDLGKPLDLRLISEAKECCAVPRELHVEFENLDNKLIQTRFADPHNWGRDFYQMTRTSSFTLDEVSGVISPYARATAERVLDPIFREADALRGGSKTETYPFNRAKNIIIDGMTVRDKMLDDYVAAGQSMDQFESYFERNCRRMTSEYVASALMAGKRVEAFIPDKYGRIPDEPVQITRTGYEPTPLKKVTLNAWERHFAKYGFFKEKVAKAAEYQRMAEARERVKSMNMANRIEANNERGCALEHQLFDRWVGEHGRVTSVPGHFSVSRSAGKAIAACALAAAGYPLSDIYEPDKLQAEKQQVGSEVMRRLVDNDLEWIANAIYRGEQRMLERFDDFSLHTHLDDEKTLFREENRYLFEMVRDMHDANQERKNCIDEFKALVANELPPTERTPEKIEDAFFKYDDRISGAVTFFRGAGNGFIARNVLASGTASEVYRKNMLAEAVTMEAMQRLVKEKMWGEKPGKTPLCSVSECLADPETRNIIIFAQNVEPGKYYQKLEQQVRDPIQQRELGRDFLNGRAQKRMLMRTKAVDDYYAFGYTDTDEKTAKTIEQEKTLQELGQKAEKAQKAKAAERTR